MVKVERDGDFLNYSRDGHIFYDPAIPSPADAARFYRHLMDKNWMTQELKAETVRLVQEWWGE
jgi:hypothetical protein